MCEYVRYRSVMWMSCLIQFDFLIAVTNVRLISESRYLSTVAFLATRMSVMLWRI